MNRLLFSHSWWSWWLGVSRSRVSQFVDADRLPKPDALLAHSSGGVESWTPQTVVAAALAPDVQVIQRRNRLDDPTAYAEVWAALESMLEEHGETELAGQVSRWRERNVGSTV